MRALVSKQFSEAPSSISELGFVDEVIAAPNLTLASEANKNVVALVSGEYASKKKDRETKVAFLLISEPYANSLKDRGDIREVIVNARNALREKYPDAHVISHTVPNDLIHNALEHVQSNDNDEQSKNDLEKEIDELLWHCYEHDVSDIHVECGDYENRIMVRQDGELRRYGGDRNKELLHTLISVMYSSMAALDGEVKGVSFKATEKLDGSMFREINGKRLGTRISSHPTNKKAKNFVMTIRFTGDQNEDAKRIPFNQLGFIFNQIDKVRAATNGKGISLLIGETNSGKSVTLENMLMEINAEAKGTKNILAVENPIERNIRGVKQFTLIKAGVTNPQEREIAVQDLMGFITRADPDDISVGEINNTETCETALQSSLTGHNVMATLHCDNPFDVFERFEGLGANSSVLLTGEVLKMAVAQKLFKKLCPHCAHRVENLNGFSEKQFEAIESLASMGLGHWIKQIKFRNQSGCEHCNHRGIKGRQLVAEVVEFSESILHLLSRGEKKNARLEWLGAGNFTRHDVALIYILKGTIDPTDVIKQFRGFTDSYMLRKDNNIPHPKVVYEL